MSRPKTGPFRRWVDHAPEWRKCDDCRVRIKRAQGRYVAVSRLRQVWCCNKCATVRETITRREVAAA